eukprot:7906977-Lingulodinium_polyedra.AAC.1
MAFAWLVHGWCMAGAWLVQGLRGRACAVLAQGSRGFFRACAGLRRGLRSVCAGLAQGWCIVCAWFVRGFCAAVA